MITKEELLRNKTVKAYVNNTEGYTKVIVGADEWEIVYKNTDSIDAKKQYYSGHFKQSDIKPAIIDDNIIATRAELKRLSEEIVRIYALPESKEERGARGIYVYTKECERKTEKLARLITGIKNSGLGSRLLEEVEDET